MTKAVSIVSTRPTAARVRELLDYDPETGVFRWRVRPNNRVLVGALAGRVDPTTSYRRIQIDGRTYAASRLAWVWMTGEWPNDQVDHRNRDRADDRWLNLRQATISQNGANRPVSRNNRSGLKGVSWNGCAGKWLAHIGVGGKHLYLGTFGSPEEAHAAYCAAAKKHFGEYARAG